MRLGFIRNGKIIQIKEIAEIPVMPDGLCIPPPTHTVPSATWGWSGGAMVLGKLPVPGRPTILIIVGQGPIALAVGAGGGGLDIFTLLYLFFPLSPSLWGTA